VNSEDRRIVGKGLAFAFFVIVLLIAVPFAWLGVTPDGEGGGQAAEIGSERAMIPN
jgi:hypothetical protein